jgi:DNA-directed RNA polymerase specialized sigma24 family protein
MDAPTIAAGRAPASGLSVRLALLGDERLARLVGNGSERAFASLYERYHQPLYRYCRSIVRDDTDAQDALQSALASAFVALKRGQRDAPLRPWLFRIAHNEAISLIRRRAGTGELTDAP